MMLARSKFQVVSKAFKCPGIPSSQGEVFHRRTEKFQVKVGVSSLSYREATLVSGPCDWEMNRAYHLLSLHLTARVA